jgi:hypothetical protein
MERKLYQAAYIFGKMIRYSVIIGLFVWAVLKLSGCTPEADILGNGRKAYITHR